MRVAIFMPRNMRFGPSNATSIDLCVHDLVVSSGFAKSTTVVCCENETLYDDLDVVAYPRRMDTSTRRKVDFAARVVERFGADLVVVQQHLPSAAKLAGRVDVPVVFHTHNMSKSISTTSPYGWLRRRRYLVSYQKLAGIIAVSEACKRKFLADWPEVRNPIEVVPNGLDFAQWNPAADRAKEIVCVGRAAPEKGLLEAAIALSEVLSTHREWTGRLIIAEPDANPAYLESVRRAVDQARGQIEIEIRQPFSRVKACYERASIALVPSVWEEPFGRTGLEAHAGGCAVISSGTGGLAEIHGECALLLPKPFSASDIAERIRKLIEGPELRQRLAMTGRERAVEKFSIDKVSKQADDIYSSVHHHFRNSHGRSRQSALAEDDDSRGLPSLRVQK